MHIHSFQSSSLYAGTNDPNKLTRSQLIDFINQLVEHCTDITEVMGSSPEEGRGGVVPKKLGGGVRPAS